MIPSIGGLSNSGSMPISASGGMAGPSTATARNSIGGIRNGSINFGGGPSSWLPWAVLGTGAVLWLIKQ
ncbi:MULTISPECIES: hypothetical protein [Vibrio]|uniref:hypothetical protein n=1 Tax=Vibrio TaxID=662 RepID=UPI0012683491|nr:MULTISPECIES: hypothetical protein [unclassified Vibrio]QFT37627.1 hypothetical protein FIU99_14495 [Vibrio sp. THAF64]QGM35529.1 hypothetical protein GGC04_14500 [Vibrio sp. THAF191d]QGN71030.1 hypothetical protein GGC03_14500 [Vibrio sp. THAF191c]